MRAMGIMVSKSTKIYVDNMSAIINSTDPGSTLNKKYIALAYHFVREHVSGKVIDIMKIDSDDNYADPLTKPTNSNEHNNFFYEILRN